MRRVAIGLFQASSGKRDSRLVPGAGQAVDGTTIEIRDFRSLQAGSADPDARRFLEPEPLIESDDPEIIAEAARAVQGVTGQRDQRLVEGEVETLGIPFHERGARMTEHIEVMRALWAGETVQRDGAHGRRYEAVRLTVRPVQDPLEVWLGGQVPAALRRCGRVGDGWMPGLCPPEEAGAAVLRIRAEAEANGRVIDREHFGMNLSWVPERITDEVRAGIEARRPGFDPGITVGVGATGLAERIEAFIDAGVSKFVIRPAVNPPSWAQAVEAVAPVLALQT